jgi:NADH:ubiquinone reductase (H+-translocating)
VSTQKTRKKVVIIGMGFGGLEAARALAGSDLDVLVLDRRNFHLFQPMLYQVATAMLDQETIATSIRGLTRHWPNVDYRMAEVGGVDFQRKRVLIPGDEIPFDYLIVAAGSVTNFFGNTEIQTHAFDLKQLHDAVALRNHILSVYERAAIEPNKEERQALLTFVIVGGGPTGVEFAGSLSELTHHVLAKDFKNLGVEPRIILVESSDHILTPFPRKLRHYATRRLEKMGVKVMLNQRVTGATPEYVFLNVRKFTRTRCSGARACARLRYRTIWKLKKSKAAAFPSGRT